MTKQLEALRVALEEDADFRFKIGGCSDGGCIIYKPKGMHTNGGCKCSKDYLKMQRLGYAHQRLVKAIECALSQQSEEPPPYPEGNVIGNCVCGSWPGGECLKCEWRPAEAPVVLEGWEPIENAPAETDLLLYCGLYEPHFFVGRFKIVCRAEERLVSSKGNRRTYEEVIIQERDWGDTPNYSAEYWMPLPAAPQPTTKGEE